MEKETVIEFIMDKINEIADIDLEDMAPDSAVMGDLEMSSFEIMTMISELEYQYKVRFTTKALRTIITIEEIADYILENMG